MERVTNLDQIKKIEKWLYQYQQCKTRIDCLRLQLENISYLQGMRYDEDKISKTYKFSSSTENTTCKIDDLKAEIHELETHLKIIELAINYLGETERKIVELKYFDRCRWFDISYEVNLSVARCKEIKNEALYKIQGIIFGSRIMADLCPKYSQQTLFSVIL